MNKWIRRILVVALVCLGVGVGLSIAGVALGGNISMMSVNLDPCGWIRNWTWTEAVEGTDGLGDPQTFSASDIKELDIDLNASSLVITSTDGSEIKVSVSRNGEKYIKVNADGDTLEIKDKKKYSHSAMKPIGITIEIPSAHRFSAVNLDLGAGEIMIDQLYTDQMDLDSGASSMDVQALTVCEDLDADLGVGGIVITQAWLGDAEIRCGAGSLDIDYCELTGDLSVEGGVGDVNISIPADEKFFNYDLQSDVGELTLFGKSYGSIGGDTYIDNNSERTISLRCGVGSICVTQADSL